MKDKAKEAFQEGFIIMTSITESAATEIEEIMTVAWTTFKAATSKATSDASFSTTLKAREDTQLSTQTSVTKIHKYLEISNE